MRGWTKLTRMLCATSTQVLALTFDDGPHAGGLNGLLDVLKAQRVPAAFFINTAPTWGKAFDSKPNQVSHLRLSGC